MITLVLTFCSLKAFFDDGIVFWASSDPIFLSCHSISRWAKAKTKLWNARSFTAFPGSWNYLWKYRFTITLIGEDIKDYFLSFINISNVRNKQCLPSSTSTRRYLAVHFSMAIATIAIKSKMEVNFILMKIFDQINQYLWSLN